MITPDEKDWTWVLEDPCPECAFDASTCTFSDVAALVRENARTWGELLESGRIRAGRPDDSTWSSLEYACHVRDVYVRYLARIERMLTEDDPAFENWNQDATAVDDRYEDQDPVVVVAALGNAAEALAARLDSAAQSARRRGGRRSDGAVFTVDSIARYMVHDTIHHVADVTRPRL